MKKIQFVALLVFTTSFCCAYGFAQGKKAPNAKTEEIVIRKNTGKTEKMTIVVDGENVTINGKPVDEYKTKDVTVLKRAVPPVPPMPPMPGDVFNFSTGANEAFLGVLTEKSDEGAKVRDVNKETAAEKAGLKKDDIITKVDEVNISSPQDLIDAIGKHKPNDKVTITYKRDGKESTAVATLGQNKNRNFKFDRRLFDLNMPEGAAPFLKDFDIQMSRKPRVGLEIQDLPEGKGVNVTEVDADSPAAKAGLKTGDVITSINDNDIEGVDDAREEIRGADDGEKLKIKFNRDGKSQTTDLLIPKKIKTATL